mmetsp:Transcript_1112/g.2731  ORF Transcript_1112/g.2731 Transcript_1112/m.2731 type:complete len:137 (-) Transcript_1112:584-994(-)
MFRQNMSFIEHLPMIPLVIGISTTASHHLSSPKKNNPRYLGWPLKTKPLLTQLPLKTKVKRAVNIFFLPTLRLIPKIQLQHLHGVDRSVDCCVYFSRLLVNDNVSKQHLHSHFLRDDKIFNGNTRLQRIGRKNNNH